MPPLFRTESNTILKRNNFGQFAAKCDKAAEGTITEILNRGARTSRSMAPSGPKGSYTKKPGYIPLKRSIRIIRQGPTRGYWESTAPHAMHVEFGTSAHPISGKLRFWWDARGRWFNWNDPRFGPAEDWIGGTPKHVNWTRSEGVRIEHPGTKAQPFLRPAYERVVRRQMMDIAKDHYPG